MMSGGSRGIGLAVALRAARDGANRGAPGQDRRGPSQAREHAGVTDFDQSRYGGVEHELTRDFYLDGPAA